MLYLKGILDNAAAEVNFSWSEVHACKYSITYVPVLKVVLQARLFVCIQI